MLINNDLFIELDSCQRIESRINTDVYRQCKFDDFVVSMIFSGSSPTAIQCNIDTTILCSATVKHFTKYKNIDRVARSIIKLIMFSGKPEQQLTGFTLVKADHSAKIEVVTFRMPDPIFLSGSGVYSSLSSKKYDVEAFGLYQTYTKYSFNADVEDRVIFFSNLTLDESSTKEQIDKTRFWNETTSIIQQLVDSSPNSSATSLARKIILDSYNYDGEYKILGDQCCGVVYFRKPRKMLLCTGPPYDEEKDRYLSSRIESYDGSIVICGGTTAGIVSRELGREISVLLGRDPSGLPNASDMEGVTMITEGVLTLDRVKLLLDSITEPVVKGRGIDIKLTRLLLNHDLVEFIVGTRINAQHQDPSIPVELELRRNVIKNIATILEKRFFKEVWIKYL